MNENPLYSQASKKSLYVAFSPRWPHFWCAHKVKACKLLESGSMSTAWILVCSSVIVTVSFHRIWDAVRISMKDWNISSVNSFRNVLWHEFVSYISLVTQTVKNLPAMQETWVRSLGQEDPLEKGMATHCNILAWRISWTEEPGRLPSMVSQRVGHGWATNTYTPQDDSEA